MNHHDDFHIELTCNKQYCGLCYFGLVDSDHWRELPQSLTHFKIFYIVQGACVFRVNGKSREVEQGHCYIVKPGETREVKVSPCAASRLYYFYLDLKYIPSLEMDYYQAGSNKIFKDQEQFIKQKCEATLYEFRNMKMHSIDMIKAIILQMLVAILRLNDKHVIPQNVSVIKMGIRQAITEIHTHACYQIDIDLLAKKLNYSRSHLEREFKQELGIAIGKYIRELRVEEAKHRLIHTSSTITSIAEDLSFDTIHKFSIFFKRHTGYSPEKYRREMIEKHKSMMEKDKAILGIWG